MVDLTSILSPTTWPTTVYALLLAAGGGYTAYAILSRPPYPLNAPPVFDAYPIVGALRFFSKRGQFLEEIRNKSKSGQAGFWYGGLKVVALSGAEGRKCFFDKRELDLGKGYNVLFSAGPQVGDKEAMEFGEKITKSLARFMRKENLGQALPHLVADSRAYMAKLSSRSPSTPSGERLLDPFDDIYRLVYQLTMRTVGCAEIAGDDKMLAETLAIFESIDAADGRWKLLLPSWVPTWGHMRRTYAGARFYMIFKKIVDARKAEGRREQDALQVLIDMDWDLVAIISIVVAALIAGQINSGINAAWILCFLADTPEWHAIIRREVDTAIAKHSTDESQSVGEVLASLSLEDWEAEFPMVDLALRETIRYITTGCGFRQNGGKDLPIGDTGEVIPKNAFAVYLFDDLQMNPDIYKDPTRWDPGRFLPDRAEDKKLPAHGYIGWGSGRHPCLGMRFAKLEMAILIATFVAHFDFSLCDENGNPAKAGPGSIDRDLHQVSPPTHPLRLKYKPRAQFT